VIAIKSCLLRRRQCTFEFIGAHLHFLKNTYIPRIQDFFAVAKQLCSTRIGEENNPTNVLYQKPNPLSK